MTTRGAGYAARSFTSSTAFLQSDTAYNATRDVDESSNRRWNLRRRKSRATKERELKRKFSLNFRKLQIKKGLRAFRETPSLSLPPKHPMHGHIRSRPDALTVPANRAAVPPQWAFQQTTNRCKPCRSPGPRRGRSIGDGNRRVAGVRVVYNVQFIDQRPVEVNQEGPRRADTFTKCPRCFLIIN